MYKYTALFLFPLLFACKKEEIPLYNEPVDGIQFEANGGSYQSELDFAFQYTEIPDEWGYPMRSYYGDSLQELSVRLAVSVLGWESNADRTFKLQARQGENLHPELVRLENSYTFGAGKLTDTIDVTLLRPSDRGEYRVELTFDVTDTDADFGLGAEEKLTYAFVITDRYPKPDDWDGRSAWLGEFSEEKYAFIVTELNLVYGYYVDWGQHNQQLRDALDAYNQAHPNNPKTFTFPVNTDSIWW